MEMGLNTNTLRDTRVLKHRIVLENKQNCKRLGKVRLIQYKMAKAFLAY